MSTTTRHECIEKIRDHAERSSMWLARLSDELLGSEAWKDEERSQTLLDNYPLIVATAQAHAQAAQAWAALHETMFGGTVRIDQA